MTMQTVFCRIYFFKLAGILGDTWQQCSPLQTSRYGDNFAPQKHICPKIAKITDLHITQHKTSEGICNILERTCEFTLLFSA